MDVERGMLSSDTCPALERLQLDLWRQMTPYDRIGAVSRLSRAVQELAMAGIRQRHPHASERECLLRLAVLKLGTDLAVRAFPDVAQLIDS